MSQSTTARDRDAGGHPTDHEVGDGGGRWDTYDAGDDGLPRAWIARVRRSLMTNGPAFAASRMIHDYQRRFYA